jgi:hypothetical protein
MFFKRNEEKTIADKVFTLANNASSDKIFFPGEKLVLCFNANLENNILREIGPDISYKIDWKNKLAIYLRENPHVELELKTPNEFYQAGLSLKIEKMKEINKGRKSQDSGEVIADFPKNYYLELNNSYNINLIDYHISLDLSANIDPKIGTKVCLVQDTICRAEFHFNLPITDIKVSNIKIKKR